MSSAVVREQSAMLASRRDNGAQSTPWAEHNCIFYSPVPLWTGITSAWRADTSCVRSPTNGNIFLLRLFLPNRHITVAGVCQRLEASLQQPPRLPPLCNPQLLHKGQDSIKCGAFFPFLLLPVQYATVISPWKEA